MAASATVAPAEAIGPNPSVLSTEINRSSREAHDTINKVIMLRITLGLRDLQNFREGILSFFYIYKTFEDEWNRLITSPPDGFPMRKLLILKTMHSPILLRTGPLLSDLAFLFSLSSPSTALQQFCTPTTPGRIAYIEHIRAAIAKEPLVIIAYAHTMYLALFAGGRFIKSKVLTTIGLFPKVEGKTREECQSLGTNLFTFDVEKGKEEDLVRGAFKRRLASVEGDITEDERKAIVNEAKEIFVQNRKLIEELDQLTNARQRRRGNKKESNPVAVILQILLIALVSLLAYRIYAAFWHR